MVTVRFMRDDLGERFPRTNRPTPKCVRCSPSIFGDTLALVVMKTSFDEAGVESRVVRYPTSSVRDFFGQVTMGHVPRNALLPRRTRCTRRPPTPRNRIGLTDGPVRREMRPLPGAPRSACRCRAAHHGSTTNVSVTQRDRVEMTHLHPIRRGLPPPAHRVYCVSPVPLGVGVITPGAIDASSWGFTVAESLWRSRGSCDMPVGDS